MNSAEQPTTSTAIELSSGPAQAALSAAISPSTSHTQTNSQTLIAGPNLQKVVLEDIQMDDDYMNDITEDSTFKQFKFQILNSELKQMIENSILDTSNVNKPFRYLTGNFIRVFEKHVELFEKIKVPIQKRNNIVYEESLRNNTVYLRINGDCKLCPKMNRVKYVFMIRSKPDDGDKFVEVEGKRRGIHNHSGFHNGENMTPKVKRSSLQSYLAHDNKISIMAKKRKFFEDEYGLCSNKLTVSGLENVTGLAGAAVSLSPTDRNLITQITNQITSKIMIKLDQINLKVNQISDRLYDLERKLETVEVADIQLIN
ncbi:hypothetical protein BpHYR1_026476 [Brachionus plicatilis]|uniref:Uncharacterized protein n=1 Tax=Brachionus plicatilis TaxID=10195 RepID=A0A3M7QH54_BRAPC|nr:hypothetical protein BpHYR1_026476 [Brachionus plicatilis]